MDPSEAILTDRKGTPSSGTYTRTKNEILLGFFFWGGDAYQLMSARMGR
jgi:hypothetical protein